MTVYFQLNANTLWKLMTYYMIQGVFLHKTRNFVVLRTLRSWRWSVLTGRVCQADRQARGLLPIRQKQSRNVETMTIKWVITKGLNPEHADSTIRYLTMVKMPQSCYSERQHWTMLLRNSKMHSMAGDGTACAASGTCFYIKSFRFLAAESSRSFRTIFSVNRCYLFPKVTFCSRGSAVRMTTGLQAE